MIVITLPVTSVEWEQIKSFYSIILDSRFESLTTLTVLRYSRTKVLENSTIAQVFGNKEGRSVHFQ